MKYIKYTVVLVLLIVGFIATSERFVYHLGHFEETFWRISFEYSLYGEEGADEIVKRNLQESIQEYSFDIYCIDTVYLSDSQEIRTIYGTEGALEDLSMRGIRPKTYRSLFIGEVEIVCKPFSEIIDIFSQNCFFVVGPIANAAAFKNATDSNRYFDVEEINEISGSEQGLYATLLLIWGTIHLIILSLTLYQDLLNKKELVVKLTLGDSPYHTIIKNILDDIIVYSILFFTTYFVFSLFLPVQYKFLFVVQLFCLTVFLNAAIHLMYTKISLKRDLAKDLGSRHILTASYVVKATSVLLTCCVLSSNVIAISEAINYNKQATVWKNLDGYSFYNMSFPSDVVHNTGSGATYDELLWYHFNEQFGADGIWMVDISEFYQENAIILNNNAIALTIPYISNDLRKQFLSLEENEFYLFIPSNHLSSKQLDQIIDLTTYAFLGPDASKKEDLTIEYYCGKSKVLGINRSTHIYGSRFLSNPIIIVDTRDYTACQTYLNVMYSAREALYRVEDREFQAFLNTENTDGCIIRVSDSVDLYQYYQASVVRTLKLMLAVSIFIILLEFMMILFLVRLEYIANGMEMAVKKALGHSLLERSKTVVIITLVSIISCTIIAITASQLLKMGNFVYISLCSIILLAAEMGLIMREAIHMDNLHVCSILKGASI